MVGLIKFLIFIVLGFSLQVSAQRETHNQDSIIKIHGYPVREGTINSFKDNTGSYKDPASMLNIQSKSSQVFSVTKGKVVNIFRIDSSKAIMIKREGYYFVYANFDMVNFKVGDKVKKGDELGQIKKQKYGIYELIFKMSKKDQQLDYFELVAYLKSVSDM
jgi:hypothetical protein